MEICTHVHTNTFAALNHSKAKCRENRDESDTFMRFLCCCSTPMSAKKSQKREICLVKEANFKGKVINVMQKLFITNIHKREKEKDYA